MTDDEIKEIEEYLFKRPIAGRVKVLPLHEHCKALIAALRAERKATERLAQKLAEYNKSLAEQEICAVAKAFLTPEFWLKWARGNNG